MTSETTTTPTIVEARREHVPFIAWTILTAARSQLPRCTFDIVLDRDEPEVLRFLEALTATDEVHFAHYSGFVVAEVDGRPAAALSGYLESERGGDVFMTGLVKAAAAIGIGAEELQTRMARGASIFNVVAHPEDDPWVVEWVATHPDFRRRGLVDLLLEDMLERGRARGKKGAHIQVFTGNDAAQRAYEKHGFAVYNEARDAEFEAVYGCPGMRHMRRAL
jgi:ribosomal protein S18 acetylase RimI-like enzyme